MEKGQINILIVEDDPTLGKVLLEAVLRAGFRAVHVLKPEEAIAQAKLQSIHLAVIDCMLPKMNGRDLAKILRKESVELPIILMSGVYRDKSFSREAMQQTGAIAFLTKPFELPALLSLIESTLESKFDSPLSPLQTLLVQTNASHKARIKAVNDASDTHSFDLIWIMSLLMHPKISGHLNVISADGEVCGVGFKTGQIVQVNQNDSLSYFGVLMVERGFITQEEIDHVMEQTGKSKKMGQRLLDAGVLSPHAIQIVMTEQQGIRLGKIIGDTSVKVNFIESDELREDAVIDRIAFTDFLNEWLMSKVHLEWLKSFYLPWMHFNFKIGPEQSSQHRVYKTPVLERVPGIAKILLGAETLESALNKIILPEAIVYPALHALIVSRVLIFGEPKEVLDFDSHRKRLARLDADFTKQNLFERLGVSSKAKDAEVKRAYHELAKILHPDKLGPQTPDDVRELTRQAFSKLSQAYEVISDPKKRSDYIIELEKGRAEAIMEAESYTQSARELLTKGDVSLARQKLEHAIRLAPPTSEIRLLHMWSQIKSPGADKNQVLIDTVREGLTKIPPEDRHESIFHFVRGLLMRAMGDLETARKCLEQAVNADSDFIDARRELSALRLQNNSSDKSKDLLRGDLKDVVGLLFKKKK